MGKEETKDDYSLDCVPREKRNLGIGIAPQFGALKAFISSVFLIVVAGIPGTVIAYLQNQS